MVLAKLLLKTVLPAALCIFMLVQSSSAEVSVLVVGNSTVFLGPGSFDRVCNYDGSQQTFLQLEWLRNGQNYKNSTETTFHLFISRNELTFEHAGEYSCQARLIDGTVLGPVSAGFLIIHDPARIIAPPIQYALINEDYTLQCSSNFTEFVTYQWSRHGEQINAELSQVQISAEGEYTCRTFLLLQNAGFEKTVELRVVVPPRIISQPQVEDEMYSNEPVTLTVQFQSRFEQNTMVTWYKDESPIPESRVQTRYGTSPDINATTSLQFSPITRSDRGTYRVEIENLATVIPEEMRRAQTEFAVQVSVEPARPSNPMPSPLNSTHLMITWILTNQTPDAGPTQLFLNLEGHPGSPVELEPTQIQWILRSEPGMRYNVSLTAMNPDGRVTTDKVLVELPPAAPLVTAFLALRLNATAFNFTLDVRYTGGGDITNFAIRFREVDSSDWITLETQVSPTPSLQSKLSWYGIVTSAQFGEIDEVEFEVVVRNARGQSTGTMVIPQMLVQPSRPSQLTVTSKTHDTLTIELQVSDKGTTPITEVTVEITDPPSLVDSINITGAYNLEERVTLVLSELEPDTSYTLVGYVSNAAGRSPVSEETTVSTDPTPSSLPLPAWVFIIIAVVGSIVLTVLIVLVFICCYYCSRKKTSGKYNTGKANAQFYDDNKDVDIPDDAPSEVTVSSRGLGYSAYARIDGRLTPRTPMGPFDRYDRYNSPVPRNPSPYFSHFSQHNDRTQMQTYNLTKSPLLTSYSNNSEYKRNLESSMDGSVDSRSVVQENNDYARYIVEQSPGPTSVPPTGPISPLATAPAPAPLYISKSLPLLDDSDPEDQLSPPHTASYATDV